MKRTLDAIDLYDELLPEVDRLRTIEELLMTSSESPAPDGLALLIGGVERRLREILKQIAKMSAS